MYCGKLQAQLARHLRRMHKDETEVRQACNLPVKERLRAFSNIKKKGIFTHNIEMRRKGENIERERRQGSNELAMCNGCKGFYSQKRISKHKKTCSDSNGVKSGSINVKFLGDYNDDNEFNKEIIHKFRNDKVGNICQTDMIIKKLGTKLWAKSARKDRRVIMNNMRTLGNLVLECRKVTENELFAAKDIAKTDNFDHLTMAIKNLTTDEHGTLKAGLTLAIGFLLKKLIKVLKGVYIQDKLEQQSTEVDNFAALLDLNWEFIFYRAQLACEQKRQNLRKPNDMPLEKDLSTFRNFLLQETSRLTSDTFKKWDRHDFIYLRNLLVSRLTLFNARRGGEPARMLLSEWMEAQNGAWIDQQQIEGVSDPLEKDLIDSMKLAYQSGKGSRRLVPVLFPKDTLPAMEKLITERKECGISDRNLFLFPNTGMSEDHVIGWNSIQAIAKLMGNRLDKPHLLIADKFRHRTSTLFALLEMPSEKRKMFYKHMGHTEQMNCDVYQSPLAIREITEVGSFLQNLDDRTSQQIVHIRQTDTVSASSSKQAIARDEEGAYSCSRNVENDSHPPSSSQNVVKTTDSREEDKSSCSHNIETGAFENDDDGCCLRQQNERRKKHSNTDESLSKRQRRYFKWSDAQAKIVCNYFSATICDNTDNGSKGALPGKKEIEKFIKDTSVFLGIDIPHTQKIDLVKAKIFNERTKERKKAEKMFEGTNL